MAGKRANGHRSRTGANGKAHGSKHNDRNFDIENAEHIEETLVDKNILWKFQVDKAEADGLTFDELEQKIYEEFFSEQLKNRNEKAIANRHNDRVQTMEQFRRNRLYCPEEVIWNIGNHNDQTDPEVMKECFDEYIKWHKEKFPNVMFLNAALHVDEPNASPHIHSRQVWFTEVNGHLEINQGEALKEMGIECPDPDKKESRRNNAKVTYTAMCHDKWEQIAEAHGIEIEHERKDPKEVGLSLMKLKHKTLSEQIEADKEQVIALNREVTALEIRKANAVLSQEPVPPRPLDIPPLPDGAGFFEKQKYNKEVKERTVQQAEWDEKYLPREQAYALLQASQKLIESLETEKGKVTAELEEVAQGRSELQQERSEFEREKLNTNLNINKEAHKMLERSERMSECMKISEAWKRRTGGIFERAAETMKGVENENKSVSAEQDNNRTEKQKQPLRYQQERY